MFYVVMYLFVTLWLVHYVTKEIRNCPYCGRKMNPKYAKFGVMWKKAKELGMTDKALITCDDDNIGSSKIIEKNGGILENKIENEDCGERFLTRRY